MGFYLSIYLLNGFLTKPVAYILAMRVFRRIDALDVKASIEADGRLWAVCLKIHLQFNVSKVRFHRITNAPISADKAKVAIIASVSFCWLDISIPFCVLVRSLQQTFYQV